MSPHAKKRVVTITITTAALGTALLGALAWGMPSARTVRAAVSNIETRTHADSTFARKDSITFWRQRDSLNLRDALRDVQQHGDSVARDLKVCIRHPGDCR